MFLDNKYTACYYRIICQAQQRINTNAYTERHHVIPKSLGGDNSTSNLVILTAREHFVCHKLLTKMTEGIDRRRMQYALVMFMRRNPNHQRVLTSRDYEFIRGAISQAAREQMTGRIVSPETRARQSAAKRITHNTVETKAKIAAAARNRTDAHRQKLGNAHRGKTITQQHKDAISRKLSGARNGRAQVWRVEHEDGFEERVTSLKTWCAATSRTFPGVFRTIKSGTFSQGVRVSWLP